MIYMKNNRQSEHNKRALAVAKDLITQYWEGEGSNTYTFCVDTYICLFTTIAVSKLFRGNVSYGSEEHAIYLAILAGSAILEFIILYLFFAICKKNGYRSTYIKIMNYLALFTTILTIILNIKGF